MPDPKVIDDDEALDLKFRNSWQHRCMMLEGQIKAQRAEIQEWMLSVEGLLSALDRRMGGDFLSVIHSMRLLHEKINSLHERTDDHRSPRTVEEFHHRRHELLRQLKELDAGYSAVSPYDQFLSGRISGKTPG